MCMEPEENSGSDSVSEELVSESEFLQLIDSLPKVSVQGYDKNRRVIYWNQSSEDIYGYRQDEALGRKLEDLIIPDEMIESVISLHRDWVDNGIPIPSGELLLKRKGGGSIPVFSSHVMLKQNTDSPEMFCIDVDMREQYEAREKLKLISITDPLTGLPNRRFLVESLERYISEAKQNKTPLAVLFIDLDMFKDINDTLGHTMGDELLSAVSARIHSNLADHEVLARFGGDEFVVIIPDAIGCEQVTEKAKQILEAFKKSFSLKSENLFITASIGISFYPTDGEEIDELLKNSDAAMYQAKESGRNRYQCFTRELSEKLKAQHEISARLRDSLLKNEFELVFQPQFHMKSHTVTACEALLRWHPEGDETGMSPDIFIPIAERSDLIIHIGEWVIKHACMQVSQWKKSGFNVRVDINVSGKQLEQADFFDMLDHYRDMYDLSPCDLGIELTEHVLISSNERMLEELKKQRDKGVSISIDDFGTGYSSLNYLKVFPLTVLKVDRSFIVEAPENKVDGVLLEAIINVGHGLNLDIIVEGVETQEQAEFCKKLNADHVQGYLYSRPVSAREVVGFFKS